MFFFFFNDTATTEIYTLSLHDALPILKVSFNWRCASAAMVSKTSDDFPEPDTPVKTVICCLGMSSETSLRLFSRRSEEHTSELQSRQYLVCRLLLEKKKT